MSAFNGSGTYVISGTGLPFVTATTISSTVANQLNADLATGLSTTICKDGQTTATARIPFAAGASFGAAIIYGGVTLSNSVTGTGSMALSASPTFTGTVTLPASSTWGANGVSLGFTGRWATTDYLSINDTVGTAGVRSMSILNNSSDAAAGAVFYAVGGAAVGSLFAASANNNAFGMSAANEVGVANTAGPASLTGTGTVYARSGGSGGVQLTSGATSWGAVSDERDKDIIEPISGAVTKLATLRTVIGKYKTEADGTRHPFLIAQDVQAVLPEAIGTDERNGHLVLRYQELLPLLIAGFNELASEFAAYKVAHP